MSRGPLIEPVKHVQATEDDSVQTCDTIGRVRKINQDAMVVLEIKNAEALLNPGEFLRQTLDEIVASHRSCINGTTACMAIRQGQKVTTANLGDSRMALVYVVKKAYGREEYRQKFLTKDHSPEDQKTAESILNKGGYFQEIEKVAGGRKIQHVITKIGADLQCNSVYVDSKKPSSVSRVNGQLALCAVIGDHGAGLVWRSKIEDVLLRSCDIAEYDLNQLLEPDEYFVREPALVASCDGLFEGLSDAEQETFLKDALYDFNEQNAETNFAKFLLDRALIKSTDNISVIVSEKDGAFAIFDGHGSFAKIVEKDNALVSRKRWDGKLVAVSAAAQFSQALLALNHSDTAIVGDFAGIEMDANIKIVGDFMRSQQGKAVVQVDEAANHKEVVEFIFSSFVKDILSKNSAQNEKELSHAANILVMIAHAQDEAGSNIIVQNVDTKTLEDCRLILAQAQGKFPAAIGERRVGHVVVPLCSTVSCRIDRGVGIELEPLSLSLSQTIPASYEVEDDEPAAAAAAAPPPLERTQSQLLDDLLKERQRVILEKWRKILTPEKQIEDFAEASSSSSSSSASDHSSNKRKADFDRQDLDEDSSAAAGGKPSGRPRLERQNATENLSSSSQFGRGFN
jgi:serine/threonine protein phosphatase PrpC